MMKCYEMVGLPGTGKSTALTRIAEDKSVFTNNFYSFLKKQNKMEFGLGVMAFWAKNWRIFYYMKAVLNHNRITNNETIKRGNAFFRYCGYYSYFVKKLDKTVIFDQGVFQFLLSVFFNEEDTRIFYSNEFQKLVDYLINIFDSTIIFWESDYEVAAERTSKRHSDCFLDQKTKEEILMFYIKKKADLAALKNILGNHCFCCHNEAMLYEQLKKDGLFE